MIILEQAKENRTGYLQYIETLSLRNEPTAFFDFVAKGTTQYFLGRLLPQELQGFYFLQNEPEFMASKRLTISSFFTESEKDTSAVFDLYYLFEVFLTSPYAQTVGFAEDGSPVMAEETRSAKDISCIEKVQDGILAFFEDYLQILPSNLHNENKALAEKLLYVLRHTKISDEDFLSLKIEDPFFGRTTDLTDVL